MGDKTPEKDKSGEDSSSFTFKPSSNFKKMKKFFKHIYEREEAKNGHNMNMSLEVEEMEQKPVINHPPLPLDHQNGVTTQLITSPKKEIIDTEEDMSQDSQASVIKTEPVEIKINGEDPKNQTPVICKDFLRNKCTRPNCSYRHENDKVTRLTLYTFCKDYQNKVCKHKNCKFVHASIFEQERYYETGIMPPEALSHLKPHDASTSASYNKTPAVVGEPERPYIVPINIRKTPPPPPPEIQALPITSMVIGPPSLSMVPPQKQNGGCSNPRQSAQIGLRLDYIPKIVHKDPQFHHTGQSGNRPSDALTRRQPQIQAISQCHANAYLEYLDPKDNNSVIRKLIFNFSFVSIDHLYPKLKRPFQDEPDIPTIYSDGTLAGPNTYTDSPKRPRLSVIKITTVPDVALVSNETKLHPKIPGKSITVPDDGEIPVKADYTTDISDEQSVSPLGQSENSNSVETNLGPNVCAKNATCQQQAENISNVIVENAQISMNQKQNTGLLTMEPIINNNETSTIVKTVKKYGPIKQQNTQVIFSVGNVGSTVLLSPRGQVAVAKRTICEQCPLMEERYKQCTNKILSLNKGVEDHIGKISSIDKMHARLYGLQIAMITIMGQGNTGRESPRHSLPMDNTDKMGVDIRSALQVLVNRLSAEELIKSWNGAVRSG